MNPAQWRRVRELFDAASRLPAAERAAFLDSACDGKASLRAEVESLLRASEAAAEFLEDAVLGAGVLAERAGALTPEPAPGLTPGAHLGPYEVVSLLGAGGMGEVYRARDGRLGRDVAIKVLLPQLAADADLRRRFEQEARTGSCLRHPNVAHIYDVGEAGGVHFIAMEYIDGQPLEVKIGGRPLGAADAVDLGVQIADALDEAHARGVVHRDIKPANILVTSRGQVKVLDFGLAKLAPTPGASAGSTVTWSQTAPGLVMGTVSYMSPEQALGHDVDHRSDIFSLGSVLYEMVTGRRAFAAPSATATIDQLVHAEPEAMARFDPDVPAELERIVDKALRKDREERYQTAREMLIDLRSLASEPGGRQLPTGWRAAQAEPGGNGAPSLVVVPFVDISPDRDNEYFSDGLTEELITDLSRVRALRVISRASAMTLKGTRHGMRAIARLLSVQYVMEGSVRRAGEQLRITARLIDAERDTMLWSDTYGGPLADVFAIQERVARAIVDALQVRLSTSETHGLAQRSIADLQAYESYLRARQEIWRFSKLGLDRALLLLRDALAAVGPNALLYGTLGHVHAMFVQHGLSDDPGLLDEAAECARRAFELDPGSVPGHWLRGLVHYMSGRFQEAVGDLKQVLAFEPCHPDALLTLGYVYALAGRENAARPLFERLLEIDPLTPLNQCMPGFLAVLEGRTSAALGPYRRMYEMDPGSPLARWALGWVLALEGQQGEAVAIFDGIAAEMPGSVFGSLALVWKHALLGQREEALAAVSPALRAAAAATEMFSRFLAQAFARALAKEAAIEWLQTAVRFGLTNYPYLAEIDPSLAAIRGEDRCEQLMATVHERWERFAT